MYNFYKTVWKPEVYHGQGSHKIFFEGWYYRLVDVKRQTTVIIIPGMHINQLKGERYAFIQVMHSDDHNVQLFKFERDLKLENGSPFRLTLGKNRFKKDGLQLDLESKHGRIYADLTFTELKPWPVRLFSPGAMGWYGFIPVMQCYHGVLSFDHLVHGEMRFATKKLNFDGGRGYIEKDWGHKFPKAYIWLQSNQFSAEGTSLFVSIADIPWLRKSFRGFLAGLFHKDKLYRFTTYTGAEIKEVIVEKDRVNISITDKKYRLLIEAKRTKGGWLYGPDGAAFNKNTYETLISSVKVLLTEKKRKRVILEDEGLPAALELNGSLDDIY